MGAPPVWQNGWTAMFFMAFYNTGPILNLLPFINRLFAVHRTGAHLP